jgi:hypothetical protein
VAERKQRLAAKSELTAERVLEELRRIAFCDVRAFFTPASKLKAISELTEEQGSALARFETVVGNVFRPRRTHG